MPCTVSKKGEKDPGVGMAVPVIWVVRTGLHEGDLPGDMAVARASCVEPVVIGSTRSRQVVPLPVS